MKKAVVYYFSGSGNSQWIAEDTKKELKDKGYKVNLINIEEKSIAPNHKEADLIGFILPIYGFGIPNMAVQFLNRLPKSNKQKTFVFISPAAHEGIGILQSLLLLKLKGYNAIKAHSVYMPDTWIAVMNAPEDEKLKKRCSENEKTIKKYIEEIEANKKSFGIANPIAIIILGLIYFAFILIGRQQAGKSFCYSKKCTKCKICYKSCPSGTIKWKNKRPYWSWNCEQCFRCINICPYKAIEISNVAILAPFVTGTASLWLYKLLPLKYTSKLHFMHPLPEFIFFLLVILFTTWLVQFLHHSKLLPPWYLTAKRKRYSFFKKGVTKK